MLRNVRVLCRVSQVIAHPKRDAGHSKWANIKHTKAVKDGQRSTLFTKLSRQLKVAVQEGGSIDPSSNIKLAQIIEQAKRANMPTATLQSVIKSTQQRKEDCKSGLIEIKGPNGLIILCEIFTSNFVRTKINIATILKKYNVSFSDGGGRHIFDQKGIIETQLLGDNDVIEKATEHAIESGAEDVNLIADDTLQFICDPLALKTVENYLLGLKYDITSASVEYVPTVCVHLNDNDLEKLSVMFDKLENCEDVVKLTDNIG